MIDTNDWIAIAGGDYVVGLTDADVARLAEASAVAARRRVDEDPDSGLDEWSELDRTIGNAEYLVRVLGRALPARTVTLAPVPDPAHAGHQRRMVGVHARDRFGAADWLGDGHPRVGLGCAGHRRVVA